MIAWIAEHSDLIRTVTAIVTAVVWLVYLQLLLSNVIRARRPNILITRGGSSGDAARCLIGNMGEEPIFVVSLFADFEVDGRTVQAVVTDRDEFAASELSSPAQATNQGPLDSGAYMDAGSFSDLVNRAIRHSTFDGTEGDIEGLELTVIAATGSAGMIAAGRRRFNVGYRGEDRHYVPATVTTRQIRNILARRRLRQRLRDCIDAEAVEMTSAPDRRRRAA